MWRRWLLGVLVSLLAGGPAVAAPPPEVEAAARRDLAKGYGSDSLGPGYQVVGWDPAERVVKPYGADHWAFYVGYPDRPYMEMLVVNMPGTGWRAVSWGQLGGNTYVPASEAVATATAQGLVLDGEPRQFRFASYRFWLLEAGGQAFLYPVFASEPPPMGVARHQLTPFEPVLRKLRRSVAWYNGPAILPVLFGGVVLMGFAAIFIWRRRKRVV